MPSNVDFTPQRCDEALPYRVGGVSINIIREYCELIAAKPCQEITRPSDGSEAFGNDLENAISYWVAVEIVDLLEVV